jgi:hypothetical protein
MFRQLHYNDNGDHYPLTTSIDRSVSERLEPLERLAEAVLMQAVIDAGKHPSFRVVDSSKWQKIDLDKARKLRGYGLTYVEIGEYFNVAPQSVHELLNKPEVLCGCCRISVKDCALNFIDRDYRKDDRYFWLERAGYKNV